MSEITAGDAVSIQEGAVYGGNWQKTQGLLVGDAYCEKPYEVVKTQINMSGEEEGLIKELNSWVAVKFLRSENSHSGTSTAIAVIKQDSAMPSGISKPDISTIFALITLALIMYFLMQVVSALYDFIKDSLYDNIIKEEEKRLEQQLMNISLKNNVKSTYVKEIVCDPRIGYTVNELYKAEPIRPRNQDLIMLK